jgi:hypothetical protein
MRASLNRRSFRFRIQCVKTQNKDVSRYQKKSVVTIKNYCSETNNHHMMYQEKVTINFTLLFKRYT